MTLSAPHLRLLLIALAVVIGLTIIYLLFASIANRSASDKETGIVQVDSDLEWIAEQPGSVHIGLPDSGVDMTCDAPTSLDEPVLVVGHNAGTETVDYDVEVRLVDQLGTDLHAVAAFRSLRAQETRSIVPVWAGDLTSIIDCSIVAIQTDRGVLINTALDD